MISSCNLWWHFSLGNTLMVPCLRYCQHIFVWKFGTLLTLVLIKLMVPVTTQNIISVFISTFTLFLTASLFVSCKLCWQLSFGKYIGGTLFAILAAMFKFCTLLIFVLVKLMHLDVEAVHFQDPGGFQYFQIILLVCHHCRFVVLGANVARGIGSKVLSIFCRDFWPLFWITWRIFIECCF